MQNNTELVQSLIVGFNDLLDANSSQDLNEQICLHCRDIFGTLFQSIAWATTPEESDKLYDLIPAALVLIDRGRAILKACVDRKNPDDPVSLYLNSVNEKHELLSNANKFRSLEHLVIEQP